VVVVALAAVALSSHDPSLVGASTTSWWFFSRGGIAKESETIHPTPELAPTAVPGRVELGVAAAARVRPSWSPICQACSGSSNNAPFRPRDRNVWWVLIPQENVQDSLLILTAQLLFWAQNVTIHIWYLGNHEENDDLVRLQATLQTMLPCNYHIEVKIMKLDTANQTLQDDVHFHDFAWYRLLQERVAATEKPKLLLTPLMAQTPPVLVWAEQEEIPVVIVRTPAADEVEDWGFETPWSSLTTTRARLVSTLWARAQQRWRAMRRGGRFVQWNRLRRAAGLRPQRRWIEQWQHVTWLGPTPDMGESSHLSFLPLPTMPLVPPCRPCRLSSSPSVTPQNDMNWIVVHSDQRHDRRWVRQVLYALSLVRASQQQATLDAPWSPTTTDWRVHWQSRDPAFQQVISWPDFVQVHSQEADNHEESKILLHLGICPNHYQSIVCVEYSEQPRSFWSWYNDNDDQEDSARSLAIKILQVLRQPPSHHDHNTSTASISTTLDLVNALENLTNSSSSTQWISRPLAEERAVLADWAHVLAAVAAAILLATAAHLSSWSLRSSNSSSTWRRWWHRHYYRHYHDSSHVQHHQSHGHWQRLLDECLVRVADIAVVWRRCHDWYTRHQAWIESAAVMPGTRSSTVTPTTEWRPADSNAAAVTTHWYTGTPASSSGPRRRRTVKRKH
jgi:hypothetical protein